MTFKAARLLIYRRATGLPGLRPGLFAGVTAGSILKERPCCDKKEHRFRKSIPAPPFIHPAKFVSGLLYFKTLPEI